MFVGSLTASGEMDPYNNVDGAKLVWADFPTGCQINRGDLVVPPWSSFSETQVEAAFILAQEYLLDDGVFVCTFRGEHFIQIVREAMSHDLELLRVLYVAIPFEYILLRGDYGLDSVRKHACLIL